MCLSSTGTLAKSLNNHIMKNLVIGIGEALWDILPDGKKIGGAPANFSYHVSQFGLNSLVISAVGHDKLGNEILSDFDGKLLNHHSSSRTG